MIYVILPSPYSCDARNDTHCLLSHRLLRNLFSDFISCVFHLNERYNFAVIQNIRLNYNLTMKNATLQIANLLKPTGHMMHQQFNLLATEFFSNFSTPCI